jgi:hypothetical protein
MPIVFVSTEAPQLAGPLVQALCARGATVRLSPALGDPRWSDWYGEGCGRELRECDAFVALVTAGYDGSTWMAHEFDVATGLCAERGTPATFLFRTTQRPLPPGFHRYEARAVELPATADATAARVLAALG